MPPKKKTKEEIEEERRLKEEEARLAEEGACMRPGVGRKACFPAMTDLRDACASILHNLIRITASSVQYYDVHHV
jgi:hypothetical protein